ncbi:unnamed protein product [Acanthosepion pharaonis]|uniref:Uncharacterized protein n=1 Tax=Acanthosepion pharaonis TaxID=158019 RepID=A0A812CAK9_ACAPH|nr:unnamed protein product [Sepia pharaonis]
MSPSFLSSQRFSRLFILSTKLHSILFSTCVIKKTYSFTNYCYDTKQPNPLTFHTPDIYGEPSLFLSLSNSDILSLSLSLSLSHTHSGIPSLSNSEIPLSLSNSDILSLSLSQLVESLTARFDKCNPKTLKNSCKGQDLSSRKTHYNNDDPDVRRSTFVVRQSSFDSRRSSFDVRQSSFVVRRSTFVVRQSSFDVHRSTFVVRQSSFVVRRSTFVVRRSRQQWNIEVFFLGD